MSKLRSPSKRVRGVTQREVETRSASEQQSKGSRAKRERRIISREFIKTVCREVDIVCEKSYSEKGEMTSSPEKKREKAVQCEPEKEAGEGAGEANRIMALEFL